MTILSSLFRRAERRRAYTDLLQLDDHLLRDIGISRSDLHQMMAGSRTPHGKAHPHAMSKRPHSNRRRKLKGPEIIGALRVFSVSRVTRCAPLAGSPAALRIAQRPWQRANAGHARPWQPTGTRTASTAGTRRNSDQQCPSRHAG